MMTLFKSLVRSLLEYCCPLWIPHKVSDIAALESVQRTFTSKIWGLQHLDYWSRLKALGLMSLQRRRERYVIIHMWKILNGIAPNDIDIKFSSPSRSGIMAKIPSLSKSSSMMNQSIYDHSFAVLGPKLWNKIPGHLHSMADPQVFKTELTKFLTQFPDRPPVKGYKIINGNSILDWNMAAVELLSGRLTVP